MAVALAITSILFALAIAPEVQAEVVADPRFGVIEPHDAPELADELGVGWGRARFNWALIQPDGPDMWVEAELTQTELANEIASGREVVGLLIGIPEWARDENDLPRGLYLPPGDPGNTWATFVREAVLRYQGQIDHWIIWNEPDVWDPAHPGFTWAGDEADFVQLMRAAYLVAEEENPGAVIHLAGMSYWWDALYGRELYYRRLLRTLVADPQAAAHNYYYDVLTLHLYFHPAGIYEQVEEYAAIQREFGLDKPIWLIETNAAPSTDPSWPVGDPTFEVSLHEQAAFMPQTLALALAAGVERVGIYKLIDTPTDREANPEPFGLVRLDGSRRPAFATARIAIDRLAGMERATWVDRHVVARVVVEGNGYVTSVLWSRMPTLQVALVPALSEQATLYDMWGNPATVFSADGYYRIDLLGGECHETRGYYCMIGGPPVYLVEEAALSGAPSPVLMPTPRITGVPTGEVAPDPGAITVTASLTVTPTLTPTSTPSLTPSPSLMPLPTFTHTPTLALSPTPVSILQALPKSRVFASALVGFVGLVSISAAVWWLFRQRTRPQ